jgi:hypothetical protein
MWQRIIAKFRLEPRTYHLCMHLDRIVIVLTKNLQTLVQHIYVGTLVRCKRNTCSCSSSNRYYCMRSAGSSCSARFQLYVDCVNSHKMWAERHYRLSQILTVASSGTEFKLDTNKRKHSCMHAWVCSVNRLPLSRKPCTQLSKQCYEKPYKSIWTVPTGMRCHSDPNETKITTHIESTSSYAIKSNYSLYRWLLIRLHSARAPARTHIVYIYKDTVVRRLQLLLLLLQNKVSSIEWEIHRTE